jgi:tRNA (guanosine-2'-O-)-methyltransferase
MRSLAGTPLKRFLRTYRREHALHGELRALLVNVEDPANVGSVFRIADGCGLDELLLAGITPHPPHPVITRVGRDKHRRVKWRHEPEVAPLVDALRAQGTAIVAIELTDQAVPYHEFDYPERTCLVVGHEEHGIPPAILARSDAAVFLPMYGKGLALNVHVALAVVCYHIRQRRPPDPPPPDPPPSDLSPSDLSPSDPPPVA